MEQQNQIKKSTKLDIVLKLGEKCDQCGSCCIHSSGFLVEDDVKNISKFLKISEEELKENYLEEVEVFNTRLLRPKLIRKKKLFGLIKIRLPHGICIFYNKQKGCKIHDVKPLHCRVGNCGDHGEKLSQWFMLNHQVNEVDPESVRQYATYLKVGGKTLEGGQLNDLVKDKELLDKILDYEVLR